MLSAYYLRRQIVRPIVLLSGLVYEHPASVYIKSFRHRVIVVVERCRSHSRVLCDGIVRAYPVPCRHGPWIVLVYPGIYVALKARIGHSSHRGMACTAGNLAFTGAIVYKSAI